MMAEEGLGVVDAVLWSRELWGIEVTAEELPGECDVNFWVRTTTGFQGVLKFARADADATALEGQLDLMDHLAGRVAGLNTPRAVRTVCGRRIVRVATTDGEFLVRLHTWLCGTPWVFFRPHGMGLIASLGSALAEVDAILAESSIGALDREHRWDLRRGLHVVEESLASLPSGDRDVVIGLMDLLRERVTQSAQHLRESLVHNDANDHNVLVAAEPGSAARVVGLIDFGDALHTWTVAEPAIAAAYAMLGRVEPEAAAAVLAGAYHERYALNDKEVDILGDLAILRLCTSVCMARRQREADPENAYLSVTEEPAWRLLRAWTRKRMELLRAKIREACGLSPWRAAAEVTSWMESLAPAPVLDAALLLKAPVVLDLSPSSRDGAPVEDNRELEGRLAGLPSDRCALGRYGEPRLLYQAPRFQEGREPRTIHLGLDLFVPAGTPVFVPAEGVVESVSNNDRPLDYGPTLILRHRTASGSDVYTLFGHLDPECLARVRAGDALSRGDVLARVGAREHNGGWPPHVHVQVIGDLLGFEGDFPGVAAPTEAGVWQSLCPNPGVLFGISDASYDAVANTERTWDLRRRHLGPSLSLSYKNPLHIVRGQGQYLFDAQGRRFLDGVNNVSHVGHSHPRVVEALVRQASILNTNTRYLHERLGEYAARLVSLFPEPLRVCFLVCSGSEANELALRLARSHVGGRDVFVLDAAYHGNTQALIDVSAYKHRGPGGEGTPSWVHVQDLPDGYRGRFRLGDVQDVGKAYADAFEERLRAFSARGRARVSFLAESLLGCGGQIVLPDGYLSRVYKAVRDIKGVCIADEVQVGFGRVGSHVWGFESQGVIPDIVTLGKPIGNGHPLAAVITTRDIAGSFDRGMEYFNTFGGNPVSCAVGMAVLDVIEEEGLQEHALDVGTYLRGLLEELQGRFPLLGDVRGQGLFLGVELVAPPERRIPAPKHAAYVVERLFERGILLSTDGPGHNVLKIKPPMVFTRANADTLVEALAEILEEDPLRVDAPRAART